MTDIEQKALIKRLRQRSNSNYMLMSDPQKPAPDGDCHAAADLLEQLLPIAQEFSDFRQEVSDALYDYFGDVHVQWGGPLSHLFIIRTPKHDPLVEVLEELYDGRAASTVEGYAACLRAALEARGLEIRKNGEMK